MKKSYKHKRSEAKWDGTLNDSEMCVDHADSEIVDPDKVRNTWNLVKKLGPM